MHAEIESWLLEVLMNKLEATRKERRSCLERRRGRDENGGKKGKKEESDQARSDYIQELKLKSGPSLKLNHPKKNTFSLA